MNQNVIDSSQWVDRYGDMLYRFTLLRVKDGEQSEEIVQNTFLAALQDTRVVYRFLSFPTPLYRGRNELMTRITTALNCTAVGVDGRVFRVDLTRLRDDRDAAANAPGTASRTRNGTSAVRDEVGPHQLDGVVRRSARGVDANRVPLSEDSDARAAIAEPVAAGRVDFRAGAIILLNILADEDAVLSFQSDRAAEAS